MFQMGQSPYLGSAHFLATGRRNEYANRYRTGQRLYGVSSGASRIQVPACGDSIADMAAMP